MGWKNVINQSLVDRDRIIFPPLHIKLGLTKRFVKVFDRKGACFKYTCKMFPALSIDNLNTGISDGPHSRRLIKDDAIALHTTTAECVAWKSFVAAVKEFLGKLPQANYKKIV